MKSMKLCGCRNAHNENQPRKYSGSETRGDVSNQLASYLQSLEIPLYLLLCGLCLPFVAEMRMVVCLPDLKKNTN
jgi:hypothetical protein